MDPYFGQALGALILVALGVLIQLLRKLSATLVAQGEKLVELSTAFFGVNGAPGLVERVNDLTAWREQMRNEELDNLRHRRATDRP